MYGLRGAAFRAAAAGHRTERSERRTSAPKAEARTEQICGPHGPGAASCGHPGQIQPQEPHSPPVRPTFGNPAPITGLCAPRNRPQATGQPPAQHRRPAGRQPSPAAAPYAANSAATRYRGPRSRPEHRIPAPAKQPPAQQPRHGRPHTKKGLPASAADPVRAARGRYLFFLSQKCTTMPQLMSAILSRKRIFDDERDPVLLPAASRCVTVLY